MSNPYTAPGANLDVAAAASYQPRFLAAHGRIGRLRYLAYSFGASMLLYLAFVPVAMLGGVMGAMSGSEPNAGMGVVTILMVAVIYIGLLAVYFIYTKRRLNDLGKSGWLGLLILVPLVNLFMWIYIQFFPGEKGPNQYGPAPVPNSGGVIAVVVFVVVIPLLTLFAVAIPAYQSYLERAGQMEQQMME